ncbi:kinase-like protein [Trametes coccinea BRFM310]|uniref:Kinase-like protein n=1 Tax=Trametes coccinea (strain BRFM310) TaxID=1353009 RepID=A0A1Y2IU76_TRAC3|nr:kinase-like protein [Trametes coccinea BRFM310]
MHGQSVIGRTAKTSEIDALRFTEKDLDLVGTLEYGQYGVIDVVTCKLDGCVYVRKSIEKRFALKTRDQCSPQLERDVLLKARKSQTSWVPHLLCAFQTPTHLNLVMDYVEGGTLWDVLESSPHGGKIPESDLRWWAPQIVSAIHWCHSQGFVHRDVKPHNFVLTANAHVRLIDFGSAAPLLPPDSDGSQRVPPEHCLVPCGTCDYISPEVLQAHEEALVALEMEDDVQWSQQHKPSGYGRETDWWSMGAMLYEMVYGIAPFFSREIRHTYARIMEHHRCLKIDASTGLSDNLQDLLRRLLTAAELRLGRNDVKEIMEHPFFDSDSFDAPHLKERPANLHVPEFTYATPVAPTAPAVTNSPEESLSRGFAFSALFQSSPLSAPGGASVAHATPSQGSSRSILREQPVAAFIGFSWGPPIDAFDKKPNSPSSKLNISFTRPLQHLFVPPTPGAGTLGNIHSTPGPASRYPFATPVRPNALTPFQTLPRASTVRRTAQRRAVSDREAMKQLVDCVGMSARKKVLESGRKPRVLLSLNRSSTLKELRFDRSVAVVGEGGVSFRVDAASQSGSQSQNESVLGASFLSASSRASGPIAGGGASGSLAGLTQEVTVEDLTFSDLDSDAPPSPSPTPRPGSAMSMLSRRSQTPTGSYFLRTGQTSREGKRSVSPSSTAPEAPRPPRYEDQSSLSVAGDVAFSYDFLSHLEKRYARLMADLSVVEGRLDEVSSMLDSRR